MKAKVNVLAKPHPYIFFNTLNTISKCAKSKKQQTSPKMLVYRLSERRYSFNKRSREASQLHSVQI